MVRQNGRILLRIDELEEQLGELQLDEGKAAGLPLGSLAPSFDLPMLSGGRQALGDFHGHSVLLIFFNPGCVFCRELVPRLSSLATAFHQSKAADGRLQNPLPVVIATGDVEQNRQLFSGPEIDYPVLLAQGTGVATAYRAKRTPSGYLIDAEGRIASKLVVGGEPLVRLAHDPAEVSAFKAGTDRARDSKPGSSITASEAHRRANRFKDRSLARSRIKRDGLEAGTPAPHFHLPRIDGTGDLALADFRGRPTLIVFSSPSCAPCNALAPKLERFHRKQPHLQIVMISTGEADENQSKLKEHRLSFPVVLQHGWATSLSYATFATPAAYLIDQSGVIARDVAVGPGPILDLLKSLTKEGSSNAVLPLPTWVRRRP